MQINRKHKKRLSMIFLLVVTVILLSIIVLVFKNNYFKKIEKENTDTPISSETLNQNNINVSEIVREYNEEAVKLAYSEVIGSRDDTVPLMTCIRINSGLRDETIENCYSVFIAGASNNGPLIVTVDLDNNEVVDVSPMNYKSLSEENKIELFGPRDSWTKNWDDYNWSGESGTGTGIWDGSPSQNEKP
ncbi:MAG: hypothetical protein K6C14_06070 [Eubacterium sp.]|nr:hypothetical protein [Eubacterium sp.]